GLRAKPTVIGLLCEFASPRRMLVAEGLAEGVGFEPTLRFPVNTLSKRAPSATRPPLRNSLPRRTHLIARRARSALVRLQPLGHPSVSVCQGARILMQDARAAQQSNLRRGRST